MSNKTYVPDKKNPLVTIVPTNRFLDILCRKCQTHSIVKVFEAGKHEFTFCHACNIVWRINDWKEIKGVNLFGKTMRMLDEELNQPETNDD